MNPIRTYTSVLSAAGLLVAAAALSGCSLLPFGQAAAPTAPVATPAASAATASVTATKAAGAKLTSITVEGTAAAAANASMTATPLSDQTEVPDVVGLDAKAAEKALKDARLDFVLAWSGDAMAKSRRVVTQVPPAGSTVTSGTRVAITAATGKGEGRPFPVWYFGTDEKDNWGARGEGSSTTQRFFMLKNRWLLTGTLSMPIEIYLRTEAGERILIHKTYKSGGTWHQYVKAVKSTEGEYARLEIRTPSSVWWEIRYGLFDDARAHNFLIAVPFPPSPGDDVPGATTQ